MKKPLLIAAAGLLALSLAGLLQAAPNKKSAARRAETRAKAAFADSWSFYQSRIERGDGLEELESILRRIRSKYAQAVPARMTMVERELAAVTSLRSLSRKNAVGGQ